MENVLTVAQKAKWIIQILRNFESKAIQEATQLRIELAGKEGMSTAWEREENNQGGIGFDRNPYSGGIDRLKERIKGAELHVKECKETLEFANDHFLSMIKE